MEVKELIATFQLTHEVLSFAIKYYIKNPVGAKTLMTNIFNSCRNLQILDLSNSGIGPDEIRVIVAALLKVDNLKELYLNSNHLCDEGVLILSKRLCDYRHLRKLSLRRNRISSEGAMALAANLQHCTQLQYLNLQGNHISEEAVSACLRHCKEVIH